MFEIINDRHGCLEQNRFVMLQGTNNQSSRPSQPQKHKKKKRKDVGSSHIKVCISGSVNQCACKMSSIKSQTKQVGRRWHMLIVIPRGYDYLQKTIWSSLRLSSFPFLYATYAVNNDNGGRFIARYSWSFLNQCVRNVRQSQTETPPHFWQANMFLSAEMTAVTGDFISGIWMAN